MNKNYKIRFFLTMLLMICTLVIPVQSVMAANVLSVSGKLKDNMLTVSGTTDASVIAAVICVYNSDESDLLAMESVSVSNGTYSNEFSNRTFSGDTYIVKVADYDGGTYNTITVKKENDAANIDNPQNTTDVPQKTTVDTSTGTKSPETGDTSYAIDWCILLLLSGSLLIIIGSLNNKIITKVL